ncbi:MAG: pilus assembly protein TadG-related protein [bacterium]
MKKISKWVSNLIKETRGQVFVLSALTLPVMVGMGAIAVDVGYVYVARNEMQNAADAGALAGAQILATGGTQSNARATAIQYSTQNMAGLAYLASATTQVNITNGGTQVQVTVNQPNLGLFLAPIIGITTANVRTQATATLNAIGTVPPGQTVPLGIYCQNQGSCTGSDLPVGRTFDEAMRHCGNQFGTSGSSCPYEPETPPEGEVFLVGISPTPIARGNNDADFQDQIRNGMPDNVVIGQSLYALPGAQAGAQSAITERLAAGNEFIIPVIQKLEGAGASNAHNVKIVDFVKVRITGYYKKGGKYPDQFDFEIISGFEPTGTIASPGQGLGIGSVTSVSMSG